MCDKAGFFIRALQTSTSHAAGSGARRPNLGTQARQPTRGAVPRQVRGLPQAPGARSCGRRQPHPRKRPRRSCRRLLTWTPAGSEVPRKPGSRELELGLELGAGVRAPGGSGLEGRGRRGGRRGRRGAGLEVEKPEAAGLGKVGARARERAPESLAELEGAAARGQGPVGRWPGEKERVWGWGLGKEREWRWEPSRGVQTGVLEPAPAPSTTLPPETQSRCPGVGATRGPPRALSPGTPVLFEPPRRSAPKAISRTPGRSHSPSVLPARLRPRLRRRARDSALAAC